MSEKPSFDIQEELKKLPGQPGVYLMHDTHDDIIYVGKAVSLKNRVRQYFQDSRNKSLKIAQMVPQIRRFEYIVTDSELEALVLECNLIKEYRPKYNTMLKDDKSYPFICVTVQEDYPRVLFSRRMKRDKSRYFGPYPSAGAVKETIELVRRLYGLRACDKRLPKEQGKERPCLYYHMHQCKAPCQGYITPEEYRRSVDQALEFLNGRFSDALEDLERKMSAASEKMEFERAAEYRDLIASVKRIGEHQKITAGSGEDRDVIALASDKADAVAQVFFIRDGRMIGRDHFYLRTAEGADRGDILQEFLKQFYSGTPFIPRELLLSDPVGEQELLEAYLTSRRGQPVRIAVPQRGPKKKLVELAEQNAGIVLNRDRERLKREEGRTIGAVKELGKALSIEPPVRIESYDISNISGFQSVGSMIVYEKGKPKKTDYRKFRIRSVNGPDDYASMEEVLTRRFLRGTAADPGFAQMPDLILMDGGKGQVHAALSVLEKLNLSIPVCGMVKDDNHRTRGLIFRDEEIPVARDSACFALVTRIQDEVHRFAIEYHRLLRGKEQVHSILDDIPNIGPARRKELMRHYQDIGSIKAAGIDELKQLPGINERAAKAVYDFFRSADPEGGI